MKTFTYEKQCKLSQLAEEIRASSITIALDDISAQDADVIITFKTDLGATEEETLTTVVNAHVPDYTQKADLVRLATPHTEEDGVPYIYATSRPDNHYVCFLGSGDTPDKIGKGTKCVFPMKSTIPSMSKDFVFNEDIYIKDGYMITKDAPIGASIDIDIVHPQLGFVVGAFGREVPIFGSGWFPMDTEDRGLLPMGMILRVTINNSSGEDDEDPPASFYVAGRFETYRPRWGTNGTPTFNR